MTEEDKDFLILQEDLLGGWTVIRQWGAMGQRGSTRTHYFDDHQSATEAALKMMSSEQLDAFDVSGEPKEVLESFGDNAFARGCLAAARLIEVGVRCVEVSLGGWDTHAANHSLQASAATTLDSALAALLIRLQERELLDNTLVVSRSWRAPVLHDLRVRFQ